MVNSIETCQIREHFWHLINYSNSLLTKEKALFDRFPPGINGKNTLAARIMKQRCLESWIIARREKAHSDALNLKAVKFYQLQQNIKLKLLVQRMRKIAKREKQNALRIHQNLLRKYLLPRTLRGWRQYRKVVRVQTQMADRVSRECIAAIKEQNALDKTLYFEYYNEKLAYKVLWALQSYQR